MADASAAAATLTCLTCGSMGLVDGGDGFFYCGLCGSQADDIIDTGVADEDFVDKGGGRDARGALYSARYSRVHPTPKSNVEPLSQSQSLYKTLSQAAMDIEEITESLQDLDHVGPSEPMDFGVGQGEGLTAEDYYKEVRMRYALGIQLMIQYQCEVLVDKFGVSPMICGISGSVWIRYVASTQIFAEGWADEAMFESERQEGGKMCKGKTYKDEPRNVFNQRMIVIWYRSLRKRIPLSCSLAVSYLACHIAREPILPTDIRRWTLEGKLPYLSAFVDIEKVIGNHTRACPLSASYMFRPSQIVPLQKLESLAASIAECIGLSLPPVNFYAIACRYLNQLSLPVKKVLPYAVRMYEWSMPPDLWLSTNEFRLPSRTCVMAILVVTIRIIYNINGFGRWESSFSSHVNSSSEGELTGSGESEAGDSGSPGDSDGESSNMLKSVCRFKSEAPELLRKLERYYAVINEKYEYSKDLPSYLKYCKDVVFAGVEPLFEDHVEKKMINQFWDFYLKNNKELEGLAGVRQKRERGGNDEINNLFCEWKRRKQEEENICCSNDATPSGDAVPEKSEGGEYVQSSQGTQTSGISNELLNSPGDISIRLLKLDMEENRFCYIPPRENIKRHDYLHYSRKRDDGSLTYVAHADYYILLRACARAAEVDIRIMHIGVLKLEKRLAWTEKRVDHCFHKIFT